MCDPLKNPPDVVRVRAQREVQLMRLLNNGPMTVKEVAEAMDINPRTTKAMMQDLAKARVVHKVLGTYKYALASGEFFHLEDNPRDAWMLESAV